MQLENLGLLGVHCVFDLDRFVDVVPYQQKTHLKLQIDDYVSTSIGLIVQIGAEEAHSVRVTTQASAGETGLVSLRRSG